MQTHLIISPSAKNKQFPNVIAFDTEALRYGQGNSELQEFYNADFYNGNSHNTFTKLSDIHIHLSAQLQELNHITLIAHNAGYDIQILGLLEHIFKRNYLGLPLKIALLDSVKYIRFADKHKSLEIVDTFNFFRTKLSKLGKSLGLTKVDESEYLLSANEWNKQLAISGYDRVRQDTEILYNYFKKFVENKDFIKGITLASTAFKTYKAHYLQRVISMPTEHIDYALAAYRGGRCEPYIINKEPVYLKSYDVNSLYPYVMGKEKYSYKFHKQVDKINYDSVENNDYNYLYNIDYSYSLNGEQPIRLPIMVRAKNGKLVQAYAAKNVWLTGKEVLEMYKQYDNIFINFRAGLEYHNDYLFTQFVNDFFAMRKAATDEVDKVNYKNLLNSSYGKFGQHKRYNQFLAYEEIEENILPLIEDAKLNNQTRIKINNTTYSLHDIFINTTIEMPRSQMNNPIIAAEITANARLHNFSIQLAMGFSHVHYTDTDSFFIDRDWTESNELGKLKLEKKGKFIIRDAKDYYYISDSGEIFTTQKGIAKNAHKLTDTELENYNLEHHTNWIEAYKQSQFSSIKSNSNYNSVLIKQITKGIRLSHTKLSYYQDNNNLIGLPYLNIDLA